jgi:putative transposase
MWRRNWARITPFFNYPPDIRKAIYTTNSVESLNRSLRKIIKTRDGFPNEEAALKLLFLALRQVAKKWTMPIHGTLDRWVGLLKGGGVGGKLLI